MRHEVEERKLFLVGENTGESKDQIKAKIIQAVRRIKKTEDENSRFELFSKNKNKNLWLDTSNTSLSVKFARHEDSSTSFYLFYKNTIIATTDVIATYTLTRIFQDNILKLINKRPKPIIIKRRPPRSCSQEECPLPQPVFMKMPSVVESK